jgi:hypothetical protein
LAVRALLLTTCLLLCSGCPHARHPAAAAPVPMPTVTWRTLLAATPGDHGPELDLLHGSLTPGRFAADVDGQCLFLVQHGQCSLLLADGTLRRIGFRTTFGELDSPVWPITVIPWDYDRDGLDDLVVTSLVGKSVIDTRPPAAGAWRVVPGGTEYPVYNLAGEFLGDSGVPDLHCCTPVDFDGDGYAELVGAPLIAVEPQTVTVHGQRSAPAGSLELLPRGFPGLANDVNGDGREEYVRLEATTRQLRAYRLDGATDLVAWDEMSGVPANSLALSGTSRRAVCNALQFYDPQQRKIVRLESPPALSKALVTAVGCVSLPDGPRRLAVPCGADALTNDMLCFYDAAGREVGRTQLAGPIYPGLLTLETAGVSHIVVTLEDRVMIWP